MSALQASGGWDLDPCCPCDVQFVQYVRQQGYRDKAVFHFGSGRHHLVGRELSSITDGHEVLAITASRDEVLAYIDQVLEHPALGHRYRLLFGDIYTLTGRSLPAFDLVTLFHLCEGFSTSDPVAVLRATSLVELFLGRLNAGGEILFYAGSTGKAMTRVVLGVLESLGRVARAGEFESLAIYRPAARR